MLDLKNHSGARAGDERGVLGRAADDHAERGPPRARVRGGTASADWSLNDIAPRRSQGAMSLSDPRGIRTLVTSVKGRCPRPG